MDNGSRMRGMATKIKMVALSTLASGILFSSVCTAADVRHNLAAGTQSFIKSYTVDIFQALFPSPDELIGGQ